MSKLTPPDLNGVRAAVQRVFKAAVVLDTSRSPAFIAGDFNGDLSPDLAVALKPEPGRLAEMNEEFPSWILRDPFVTGEARIPRLRVAADDKLLAVIHGYGANGWRDPQATQTFLLKHAAGLGMKTLAPDAVMKEKGKKLPPLRGDVIGEEVGGAPGFLYYASATYSWYDPKTFKGDETERPMVHSATAARIRK